MARRRNGGDAIGVAAQLLGLLVVSIYRIATRPKHSQIAIAKSEDALSRAERLNQLLADRRDKLSGQAGTKVALQLLDMIAANPFLTPRGAQDRLNLAYNTVMRAIGQLEKLNVLKEVSEAKRDRVYCAKAILDILEEPARLTPVAVA